MTTRIDTWPQALNAFIAQSARTPFAWGSHDCCQFARRGIKALKGGDPASDWALPDYSTAAEAAALLERLGGIEALPAKAGLEEISVSLAQRGDVMLTEFENRNTLGLCNGLKSAFTGKDGLVYVPTLSCLRAWRV